VRMPGAAEKEFLAADVHDLPEHGRLTGRDGAGALDSILRLKPDLIIDSGTVNSTYAGLANNVQSQTGIPYLLMDGRLERTAAVYRQLGDVLGVTERGELLARYAEETLDRVSGRLASIAQRPLVYYARGADGLETRGTDSISGEVLQRLGASMPATADGTGRPPRMTSDQVAAWNPRVLLIQDPQFARTIASDPAWSALNAVRERRVHVVPHLPYGWLDTPPGVNRLIGLRWLASILYPKEFPEDVRDATRHFYKLFYRVDLTEEQLDRLLVATGKREP
jgi:iron complex transport system substrate-binding protein